MGMFDYLICEAPLPETPEPPPAFHPLVFQTKDTPEQYFFTYTITNGGRLMERGWNPSPNSSARLLGLLAGAPPPIVPLPEPPPPPEREIDDFHGDIVFYTGDWRGPWWEYKARFTDGRLARITLVAFKPSPRHDSEETP